MAENVQNTHTVHQLGFKFTAIIDSDGPLLRSTMLTYEQSQNNRLSFVDFQVKDLVAQFQKLIAKHKLRYII